jgi:hypothetical protein
MQAVEINLVAERPPIFDKPSLTGFWMFTICSLVERDPAMLQTLHIATFTRRRILAAALVRAPRHLISISAKRSS